MSVFALLADTLLLRIFIDEEVEDVITLRLPPSNAEDDDDEGLAVDEVEEEEENGDRIPTLPLPSPLLRAAD